MVGNGEDEGVLDALSWKAGFLLVVQSLYPWEGGGSIVITKTQGYRSHQKVPRELRGSKDPPCLSLSVSTEATRSLYFLTLIPLLPAC